MASTPSGLPYPVGTDKVVDGDNAIKALAEAIEARGGGLRIESRVLLVTCDPTGQFGQTFLTPFITPPTIVVTAGSAGPGVVLVASIGPNNPDQWGFGCFIMSVYANGTITPRTGPTWISYIAVGKAN